MKEKKQRKEERKLACGEPEDHGRGTCAANVQYGNCPRRGTWDGKCYVKAGA